MLVLCSCSRAALALFLSLTFARFARDRPLTWAPGGRAGTALVGFCEPDGAPPVATTVPAVADQPQASGRQDAVQHEPSPRPRKKKRRPKGPARIAKERSRMQAYLESAKFVEHQCQALVTANAATATAATGGGGWGDVGRWVESGSGSRIVSCDAVPAPECRCTADCFADATSRNPCFSPHPGDSTDEEAQPGTLRLTMLKKSVLASAPRPASKRSHLGAASRVSDAVTLSDSSEDEDPGPVWSPDG